MRDSSFRTDRHEVEVIQKVVDIVTEKIHNMNRLNDIIACEVLSGSFIYKPSI